MFTVTWNGSSIQTNIFEHEALGEANDQADHLLKDKNTVRVKVIAGKVLNDRFGQDPAKVGVTASGAYAAEWRKLRESEWRKQLKADEEKDNDKRTHPIRIVIASDDPIFRDELRRLESEQDMKVVGEACDGFEAVKLATEIKPDILLLDLDMPHHTGLDALRDLNRAGGAGPVRIILLTAAVEKKQVVEALQLGARGVVLKCTTGQLLLKSIHAVMAGEYWVGRDRISNLVQCLRDLMRSVNEEQKNFGLTPRELQIISGVVAGYSDREIAQYIKFTEDTIKFHLSHIFDKLGVSTRSELAQFAVNHRLPLKAIL